MQILGIRIDNLTKKEILEKIEFFLNEPKSCLPAGRFHQIATINPEFILEAKKNKEFRKVLSVCDLNVADGSGIFFAFLRFGKKLKCRFAGVDLMDEILKIAEGRGLTVFLAINKYGLSSFEEIKKALLKLYPGLLINGTDMDPSTSLRFAQDDKNNIVADILLVNFGAPHQEIFLNSQKNDKINLAMGVGGSFDYLTGKVPRAPKWMRKIGLEWLFRLIIEPQYRFKRIFRAIIIFPLRILLNK